MLCSLDTKGREAQFLANCLQDLGAVTVIVDIGYGGPAKIEADISAAEIATAAGTDMDSIFAMQDTGAASQLMMQGAIIKTQELLRDGRCDGIIGFGGASNTVLATGVMKTLPVGIPKLVISSAAAMPAYAAMFFGSRDITIMHSVVDISGLNDLTRAFLQRGAGAVCGMAASSGGKVELPKANTLIAVSGFRFAEACSQAVMRELEQLGYTPIPFHAQGVGENAMENLLGEGLFVGVVDIVPAGLGEHLLGGNRAAREDRLEAAGRVGIPQVIAPSGFDMISCGPIERRDKGDPLWLKLGLADREISIPDRFRVEARTTADEVAEIGRVVAKKLNKATGPVSVFVPTGGWSSLSVKGRELYDLEADASFAPVLREELNKDIAVVEVTAELNSDEFAHELVKELHRMLEAAR